MIQTILVIVIFVAALVHLAVLLYKQFSSAQNGCAKNCGCSMVNTSANNSFNVNRTSNDR